MVRKQCALYEGHVAGCLLRDMREHSSRLEIPGMSVSKLSVTTLVQSSEPQGIIVAHQSEALPSRSSV